MLASLSTGSTTPLHDLGDLLEVGILAIDAQLVVRGWNRWLEAASGRREADVVGHSLLTLFPELRGSAAEAAFLDALGGNTVVLSQRFHQFLLPLPAAPGYAEFERMQQSARIIPLVSGDGHVEGALALIQDVTDRVAREEELRRAMQRAEEASRAKSEFLAAMSHDFRTPLGAIIGYANMIAAEMVGPVTALQQQHLDRMKTSAQHLISMIEEVLAFATVEAGKATVRIGAVDAGVLARETVEMLEPQAAEKQICLTVVAPDTPVPMQSDTTKVRQILVNLVGNALKFTQQGTVTLEVTPGAEQVVFSVRDTGPGIEATDLTRIFEPFTHVDPPGTRRTGGTGLGLPVSRVLARMLGGDITVESRRGEGSTFTLTLPRDARAADAAGSGTASASTAA